MSARAAAQLELLGFGEVLHYFRGKADWLARGLPCEPRPALGERIRVLPFFINNLAPQLRSAWIRLSRRPTVGAMTLDDLPRLGPFDPPATAAGRAAPAAVVLNSERILLGAIDGSSAGPRALECMNPGPQTIRPDMTHALAARLLKRNRYLLVTTARGRYLGRYAAPRE